MKYCFKTQALNNSFRVILTTSVFVLSLITSSFESKAAINHAAISFFNYQKNSSVQFKFSSWSNLIASSNKTTNHFAFTPEPDFTPDANNIVYVNEDNENGDGSGNNWVNAYPDLADVLSWARRTASSRDYILKIYIAVGKYIPTRPAADDYDLADDRDVSFVLSKNVEIYGGFDPANNVTTLNQRTKITFENTILSGDIDVEDDHDDNAYHVVIAAGALEHALIDGLTIKDGNADGAGGVAVVVNGKNVYRSAGAAIYNIGSTLILQNATITNNQSNGSGAALYNDGTETLLKARNNIIKDNIAVGSFVCTGANAEFVNCLFKDNTLGAAKDSGISTTKIYNSIIYNNGSSLDNCVNFQNIHLVQYSIVCCENNDEELEHVRTEPTNILYDGSLPEQHLTGTAADFIGVNKGNNNAYLNLLASNPLATDINGNSRRYNNSTIDIGPFEYQGAAPDPLPVTLISFNAKKANNFAQLTWKTANEVNHKAFEIYRSGDDKRFVKIGTLLAGQANQFTDNTPLNGNNYYQLVQVDLDGSTEVLATKLLQFALTATATVYPNPTRNNVYLPNYSKSTYSILDLSGKTLVTGNANALTQGVSLSHVTPGLYFIRLDGKSYKFIKQ